MKYKICLILSIKSDQHYHNLPIIKSFFTTYMLIFFYLFSTFQVYSIPVRQIIGGYFMKYLNFDAKRPFDLILLGRVAIDLNPAVSEGFKPLRHI